MVVGIVGDGCKCGEAALGSSTGSPDTHLSRGSQSNALVFIDEVGGWLQVWGGCSQVSRTSLGWRWGMGYITRGYNLEILALQLGT